MNPPSSDTSQHDLNHSCDPQDIALKSFFLGPQAENAPWLKKLITELFESWFDWRRAKFSQDGSAISVDDQKIEEFIDRKKSFEQNAHLLLKRFEKEVPRFSPRYIGHMLSEISLPALIGHVITLLHNPNNISGEASLIGIELEDEAIGFLLKMVGFPEKKSIGHFTSGGTIANFESLLRARHRLKLWSNAQSNLSPFQAAHQGWNLFKNSTLPAKQRHNDPVILVPENKHYSWKKGVSLMGYDDKTFWAIQLNQRGKLSLSHLRDLLLKAEKNEHPILMVVSVAGTTELGEIDPVHKVQALLNEWRDQKGIHIWHHVDAAYGGFFKTLGSQANELIGSEATQALNAMAQVNSITLDPHKLGYVPYASGAFLVRSRKDYYVKTFDSPYIDFDSNTDKGPYTIEGSRSAAGAAATWLTARTIGLDENGYGRIIGRTIRIRKKLEEMLLHSDLPIQIAPFCETNILCFTLAKPNQALSQSNQMVSKIYHSFNPRGDGPFFVSKTSLKWPEHENYLNKWLSSWNSKIDEKEVKLIRLCLMNPFFDSIQMQTQFSQEFISELKKIILIPLSSKS